MRPLCLCDSAVQRIREHVKGPLNAHPPLRHTIAIAGTTLATIPTHARPRHPPTHPPRLHPNRRQQNQRPPQTHLALLRLRRMQLHLHEGRPATPLRTLPTPAPTHLHPLPPPPHLRRPLRTRPQMGRHQHLHRRRQRQLRLRLHRRRQNLRHLRPTPPQTLRPTRLHAQRPLHPSRKIPHPFRPRKTHLRRRRRRLSPQGLQQMARTRP